MPTHIARDLCGHPANAVRLGEMIFRPPGLDIDQETLFKIEASCLACVQTWKDPLTMPRRIFTVAARKIANGMWKVLTDPGSSLDDRAKFLLTKHRDAMLELIGDEGY